MKKINFLLTVIFVLPLIVYSQWSPDSSVNTPVSVQPNWQYNVRTIPDGSGGAFVCWADYRAGNQNQDIYAQHLDAAGNPLWTANGVAVCTAIGHQYANEIASDGQGGIVVTWTDLRVGMEVYAQRVNSLGAPVWQSDGLQLSDGGLFPKIISVTGGVIVAWTKEFNGVGDSIYFQKIKSAGQIQWGAGGRSANIVGGYSNMVMVADEAEGAIVSVMDLMVYAQRISESGIPLWGLGGKIVCNVSSGLEGPVMAATHEGHFIIAWKDYRNDTIPFEVIYNIYAQKLDTNGNLSWTTNGVRLSSDNRIQDQPDIVSDGNGGAIIAFRDYGNQADPKIFGQHVAANGALLWNDVVGVGNQLSALSSLYAEGFPSMVADGNGGAYVTWTRYENWGTIYKTILAQHVSGAGVKLWSPNSVVLSNTALTFNEQNQKAVSDGNCGIIVFWEDERNGNGFSDIYANHVDCTTAGPVPIKFLSFTGKHEGPKNLLEWSTAVEQNSLSFTLEKSNNGHLFNSYKSVSAAGSASQVTRYQVYDDDPFNGTTFYRLRQTDIDGTNTFSSIIELRNKQRIIRPIYPNPGNGVFTVELNGTGNTVLDISVMDATGRRIYYSRHEKIGNGYKQKVDISQHPKGTYFVKMKTSEDTVVEKLVVD